MQYKIFRLRQERTEPEFERDLNALARLGWWVVAVNDRFILLGAEDLRAEDPKPRPGFFRRMLGGKN